MLVFTFQLILHRTLLVLSNQLFFLDSQLGNDRSPVDTKSLLEFVPVGCKRQVSIRQDPTTISVWQEETSRIAP